MREFIIHKNDAGQRLDKFIIKLMPKLPKSMLYKGLRKNCVRLNGKHAKDGAVYLESGDVLRLYFKDEFFESEKEFKYIEPNLDIAYEDGNILIINKAVGVAAHPDGHNKDGTLIDMVKSYLYMKNEYNPKSEQTFSPALCNRLDRNTGGLVIAAKNAAALREMNERIKKREVRKFYKAVVEGYPKREGRLEGFISRRDKITSVSQDSKTGARAVSLDYRVISQKNGYSLVEIELHTGRTHQIRAQFSDIGHPLAGDTKYGGHGDMFRQALWSVGVKFDLKDSNSALGYLNGMEITTAAPFEKEF